MTSSDRYPHVTEVRVHIDIKGVDPDEVTRILGMEPDESWREGDPRIAPAGAPAHLHRKQFHLWSVSARSTDRTVGVDSLLAGILRRLKPARARFSAIPEDAYIVCEVWLGIVPALGPPSCAVDAWMVDFLAAIGANIDIDISVWDGPPVPEP